MLIGWLPIVGPLIEGVVSIVKGRQDVAVKKDTNDVEEIKARIGLLAAINDDIGIRLTRDIIMFPVGIWTALISWDTIWAIRHPDWMFHVEKYPPVLEYLPFAVIAFLFGIQMRKRF